MLDYITVKRLDYFKAVLKPMQSGNPVYFKIAGCKNYFKKYKYTKTTSLQ